MFRRGEQFIVSGTNAERAVELARTASTRVADKPMSVEDIQLALVEQRAGSWPHGTATTPATASRRRPATMPTTKPTADDSPVLNTRRSDLRGRTPNQSQYLQADPRARHHLRHRPGRHRQDLSRGRLRGRRAGARRGQAHRADAPRGRSRRAPRLPARRPGAEGRSLPAPAVRRAVRPDGLRHARRSCSRRRRSRSRRSPTCAGAR